MPAYKTIDAKTAKEWLAKNEAILVDVREPGEHQAMKISGSKLIPVGSINKEKLPDIKNQKIIIHCHVGRRGGIACEKLLHDNPDLDLYNLEGGISAWEKAGFAVEKSGRVFIPVDRQVQIVVGCGVLLGLILGYFIHPGFLLLSGFFGAGMLYAGISGSCGMATMLSMMPWNQGKSS